MNRSREIGILKSRIREIEARCSLSIDAFWRPRSKAVAQAHVIDTLQRDTLAILKDVLDLESESTNR